MFVDAASRVAAVHVASVFAAAAGVVAVVDVDVVQPVAVTEVERLVEWEA